MENCSKLSQRASDAETTTLRPLGLVQNRLGTSEQTATITDPLAELRTALHH